MRRMAVFIAAIGITAACFRIGEPTESAALVTWGAWPDTVVVGELFSFEFAGPVAPTTCGRLDTATVALGDSTIRLGARRSTYETLCSSTPVAFYEARPLRMPRAGQWSVETADGRRLGHLTAVDSGKFAALRARGEGTVESVDGCLLFGPGWVGNQRLFALRGAPDAVAREAGTRRRVWVRGTIAGFTLCGSFGSRPVIVVDTAIATDSTADEYYTEP